MLCSSLFMNEYISRFEYSERTHWDKNINNKAISMMRGKSPRSDVELSKKLNFVAAILDIRSMSYFWNYIRKTHFWPFIYIFQMAMAHLKIVRLTWFFSYGLRTFQLSIFVLWVLSLSKNHERKNVKKLNFVAAILDFWRPSWTDNGYFLTLYSLHGNDHLYKFW